MARGRHLGPTPNTPCVYAVKTQSLLTIAREILDDDDVETATDVNAANETREAN